MMQWCIELCEFRVQNQPRLAIKAQSFADFITECSYKIQVVEGEEAEWKLYIDGASSKGVGGARVVLKGPNRVVIKYALRSVFKVTNNMAQYEALSKGLDLVKEIKPRKFCIYNDSQLIVSQVNGQFETKKEKMAKYQRRI